MAIEQLPAAEIHARSVEALGLDPAALELTSVEALACSLRRAAGFLCPCSRRRLIDAVVDALEGLVDDISSVRTVAEQVLEALTANGDLLEHAVAGTDADESGTLIYIAPPTFVRRASGSVLLLGVVPDRVSVLPHELEVQIEYVNHARRLAAESVDDLASDLLELGFIELSLDAWLKAPPAESAVQHLSRLRRELDAAPPSGEVPGLTLLDPKAPVRYYPRRWVPPTSQTGRFVAKRKQLYGADLWCYVEMGGGLPKKFIDFPLPGSRWRGCDEAWQLQAAIDAERGNPQRFRLRSGSQGTAIDFFSPVPAWAQRRWDAVGDPMLPSGCLLSYRFSEQEVAEEVDFIRDRLWMAEANRE